MADYIKISDTSIEVTTEVITPTVTKKNTYERGFIESQILAITAQRDEMIAAKERELKECEDILDEMDKLGVVAKQEPTPTIEEELIP